MAMFSLGEPSFSRDSASRPSTHRLYPDRFLPFSHPENAFSATFFADKKPLPEDRNPYQDEIAKIRGCTRLLCYTPHRPKPDPFEGFTCSAMQQEHTIEPIVLNPYFHGELFNGTDDFYNQPISQNGRTLAFCSKQHIHISEFSRNKLKAKFLVDGLETMDFQSICLLSPSMIICSINPNREEAADLTILLYDFEAQQTTFRSHLDAKRVGAISFCPSDPAIFATGDKHGDVRIWDVRQYSDSVQATPPLLTLESEVCGLQFSPWGDTFISGTDSNTIFLWDQRNLSSPVFQSSLHRGAIKAMSWINRSHFVTGGGLSDKTLYLWSTDLQRPVNKKYLHNQISGIKVISDRIFVSLGHSQNCLKSFKFDPRKFGYPITEEASLVALNANRFFGLAAFKDVMHDSFTLAGFESSSDKKPIAGIHYWTLKTKKDEKELLPDSFYSYEIR